MNGSSDTKIRNAKPADQEYTIDDGQGLSVVVRPNSTKPGYYNIRQEEKRSHPT